MQPAAKQKFIWHAARRCLHCPALWARGLAAQGHTQAGSHRPAVKKEGTQHDAMRVIAVHICLKQHRRGPAQNHQASMSSPAVVLTPPIVCKAYCGINPLISGLHRPAQRDRAWHQRAYGAAAHRCWSCGSWQPSCHASSGPWSTAGGPGCPPWAELHPFKGTRTMFEPAAAICVLKLGSSTWARRVPAHNIPVAVALASALCLRIFSCLSFRRRLQRSMQYILAAALQQYAGLQQAGSRQPEPQLVLVKVRIRGQQPVHIAFYGIHHPAAA